jgi:hypothetical protein
MLLYNIHAKIMSDLMVASDKFLRDALEDAESEVLTFYLQIECWIVVDAFLSGFQQLKEFIKAYEENDAGACCDRIDQVIAFYTELRIECTAAISRTRTPLQMSEDGDSMIGYCESSLILSETEFGRHLFGVQSAKYPFWPPQPTFFQEGEEEPDLDFELRVTVEELVTKALEFCING